MSTATITPRQLTATMVVAASDSIETWRASWSDTLGRYLICDGVNDDEEIAAALTDAAGGSVTLLDGTYSCTSNITVPADTTLKGQGYTLTNLSFSGASVTNGVVCNGDNIVLKDLKITITDGTGTGGSRPNAVYVNNHDYLLISNVGIDGDNSVADDGSAARQNGICLLDCNSCKVLKCEITANKRNGVYLYQSDSCFIKENHIYDNTDDGILLTTNSNNCIINANNLDGNDDSIHLENNACNNTITSNCCQISVSDGIYVDNCINNTITGNICQGHGNGRGIYITSSDYNTITGNNVFANGTGATKYSGIYVEASDCNVISANNCEGNGLHGIFIFRSNYCSVVGNVCVVSTTADGINVEGDATGNADYNTLTGNVCTLNADDGIAIEGGANANKNIVVANSLLGNTGTNLVDNGNNTESGHNVTV
jgi:parallel beta-helix repeat protein